MFRSAGLLSSFLSLAGVLTVLAPGTASATITVFDSEGSFTASLGSAPVYTENFASMATGATAAPVVFNSGNPPLSFSVGVADIGQPTGLWRNQNSTPYGSWVSTNAIPSSLLFTFPDGGVKAVGGNFFLTNVTEAYTFGSINVSVNGGAPVVINSVTAGDQPYLGLVASGGETITTLVITPITSSNPGDNLYPTATNVTVAAIPESGSACLALAGIATMALRRKR